METVKRTLSANNLIVILLVGILVFLTFDRFFPTPDVPVAPTRFVLTDTAAPQAEITHESVLQFILDHEGALSKEEGHGGYSNRGITQESWHEWRNRQGEQSYIPASVRDANLQLSKRFYYDYFNRFHVWDLHPALQLLYADFATLAGSEATRELQRLLKIHSDGVWGPRTTAAVAVFNASLTTKEKQREAFETLDRMKRDYFMYLGKHLRYKKHLQNWLHRSDDVKAWTMQYLQ